MSMEVNRGHFHEIMDRAHIICTMIDEFLIDHPGMTGYMNSLCEGAQKKLYTVYCSASVKEENVFGEEKLEGWQPYWVMQINPIEKPELAKGEYVQMEVTAASANIEPDIKPDMEDMVNQPPHYKVIGDIEAIDIIRELLGPEQFIAYCYGNVLKYSLRAKKKENFMQDLNKAKTYINFITGE